MLNYFFPRPLAFLTTRSLFRQSIIRILLSRFGCIGKNKNVPDLTAIQEIMTAKKEKRCIAIFPEGQNSWDGETHPIIPSTIKLIKLLRIPTVIVHIEGSHFSDGRWTHYSRRGHITINFRKVLYKKDIARMQQSKLLALIQKELSYSETEKNRNKMVPFVGKARAEYLERSLFVCPHCLALDTLRSLRIHVQCIACKYTVQYTEHGFFTLVAGKKLYFDSIPAWNSWQQKFLKNYLQRLSPAQLAESIFCECGVLVHKGTPPVLNLGRKDFILKKDKLILKSSHKEITCPLTSVYGINIQKDERMEFFCNNQMFRITFPNPRTNAYKLLLTMNFLKKTV